MPRKVKIQRSLTITDSVLFYFNVLIGILITIFSIQLFQTQFGKATLFFGIIMLGICTLLRILEKW